MGIGLIFKETYQLSRQDYQSFNIINSKIKPTHTFYSMEPRCPHRINTELNLTRKCRTHHRLCNLRVSLGSSKATSLHEDGFFFFNINSFLAFTQLFPASHMPTLVKIFQLRRQGKQNHYLEKARFGSGETRGI